MLFSRECGTPNRLTMIYCQMREGSVLSAGPPVSCLPSPVPVAPTSWSVSITSRTSALALLKATRSSVCLQKHRTNLWMIDQMQIWFNLGGFLKLTFLSFTCTAINIHLPSWSHCSRLWRPVLSPMKTGHLKLTRFWKRIKIIKMVRYCNVFVFIP